MATPIQSRQQRSSTVQSAASLQGTAATAELRLLLDNLSATLQTPSENTYPDLPKLITQAQAVRQHLIATPETIRAKDDFRHLQGFQVVIETLRAFSGFYHPTKRTHEDKARFFELFETILGVLSEAFREHYGNQRYFKRRAEGGGWSALEQAVASIGVGGSESDIWGEAELFGRLLAFALNDKRLQFLCQNLAGLHPSMVKGKTDGKNTDNNSPKSPKGGASAKEPILKSDKEALDLVQTKLKDILGESAVLSTADAVPVIIDFWKTMPRAPSTPVNPAALVVILALSKIASVSKHNLLALHSTGILSTLLPLVFDLDTPLSTTERTCVEELCRSLISFGVSALDDAKYLVSNQSSHASEFLLRSMKESQSPAYIQFDLSLHGYASIELPTLGRSFPPHSSLGGYAFVAWIYIDQFDPNSHTTIFGAFDTTQTCFVLAYLERDTHNFILQTSVTSTRPSVRFRSTMFNEGRWYHIAIVHRRPRTMSSSKALLYVDGEFVEQVKSQYPAPPPVSNGSTESFTSFTSSTAKTVPVQAFLGTPQDLSSRLGRGVVFSRWSLASAHLFEDCLSDDLIAVYYRLGPRYNGNFQDCLGSFQTYEASAALGMRNELMHPGKDESSDIITAIREKASTLVPESRILLSILPCAVLADDGRVKPSESQLVRGLSRSAANNLYQSTHHSGASLAINAAVPAINEALVRAHGTTVLTGEPVVIVPQTLDDAMWRLGGFSGIALKMVEDATTTESIVRAVEILFESIKGSWRNSEAMERENGYAILGALLRGKIGAGVVVASKNSNTDGSSLSNEERDKLGFQLLSLVLDFLGYTHDKPEESFIINPLAYRVLLVDFDMWRKTAPVTQKLYYKQFITFGVQSKFHQFNSKRLLRMRIVKRLLDALKAETFSHEVFPYFMEALEILVKCNMTTEVFRSLALFITYAYHQPTASSSNSRTPKVQGGTAATRPATASGGPKRPLIITQFDTAEVKSSFLTKKQLGSKVLQMYTGILCEKGNTANIKKFARSVTNKWLLHLLTEDDEDVIIHGTKILARLLVIHGSTYVSKFADKAGGFAIMRFRLKKWWSLSALWPMCFSILFGYDISEINFDKPVDLSSFLETFSTSKIVYPAVLPVITTMLQRGLKDVLVHQGGPDSPRGNGSDQKSSLALPIGRPRTMSLNDDRKSPRKPQSATPESAVSSTEPGNRKAKVEADSTVLEAALRFLADLHTNSSTFRDFAMSSEYVRLLLAALFPIVVSTDAVNPETELNSRGSALTFEGDDVIIQSIAHETSMPTPIIRTSMVDSDFSPAGDKVHAKPLRRGSSFILVTAPPSPNTPSSAKLDVVSSPHIDVAILSASNTLVEGLQNLVVNVFVDQVMARKEFPDFGLPLKVPPGFREHQAYFESYVLRNTITRLEKAVQDNQRLLLEPRLLQNMSRFVQHMGEAVFEGWFLAGAEPLLDFAGSLLEYLQRPEISKIKSVRLCSQAVIAIKHVFLKVVLLRLSELDTPNISEVEAITFMDRLNYWQMVVLSSNVGEEEFLKLICYQLYLKLAISREKIRLAAANLWRILLVQKPEETSRMLQQTMPIDYEHLNSGFKKLMELDNETFVGWVDEHRKELDALFAGAMSRSWDEFVTSENEKTEEAAKRRMDKRREKLSQWHSESLNDEDILFRHDLASALWMKHIYAAEHIKHQRTQQDQQDNFVFLASVFSKMDRELHRPCAVFETETLTKWKLDRTEARNRMRLRMVPDRAPPTYDYKPKRRTTDSQQNAPATPGNKLLTAPGGTTPSVATPTSGMALDGAALEQPGDTSTGDQQSGPAESHDSSVGDEDFEFIDDPNDPEGDEGYEDKNRKVMRSLQRGDSVQHVFNISRIVGLEAIEGLLILGKDSLYIIDNVFQRSDGEIVDVWQAPKEERDPYLQMIAGQKDNSKQRAQPTRSDQESRSWKWSGVISISKRSFLFRDVAAEIFFTDGRSYLLTAISNSVRNELYTKLISKTPHATGNTALPNPEDGWRLEALTVSEESSTSFGSKFGNIFNSSAWNPAMRRWAKGEISNFHYLMLVNTMAGRSFNDLTQYPVFPWILADYTSEELDLENPASFRDLTKPMGTQTISRQMDFIDRYKTFADMSDQNTPAFHYGTHYSSAMIVTSYLIRLQPFVQSYLLLQGGHFDHPDRLFYSIEKAWMSASRDNMSDVRELIPEFFYLPEFLTNSNGYDFGLRQGNKGAINDVQLPPWAKGDPKIFIAKHREALESPYVSKNLHHWIDLVFGSKQRGEPAIENVNVFHFLSYPGAKDLDTIEDPVERLATIGIIHNFGQTPHQVFSKSHQPREEMRHKFKRLDTAVEDLTRLPFPLLESHERVASLVYAPKLDRLLCATSFRLNLPPQFDKYLEWGFADNSVRFYFSDSKKIAGLFENLHQGQLSCAIFASSQILITAGEDCVLSAHTVITSPSKPVDLQPRSSLFGHSTPVTTLSASKSFCTLLSASGDGTVILWDLNRLEFVRKLAHGRPIQCARINDITGDIMLCRGQKVVLYTLNGDLILEQNVCSDHDDYIASCTFYEGTGNEWLESTLIFTGHKRGVVNVWRKVIGPRKEGWKLEFVKRLDQVDSRMKGGEGERNIEAAITCITAMPHCVYTGDEDGGVYEWDLVQRER